MQHMQDAGRLILLVSAHVSQFVSSKEIAVTGVPELYGLDSACLLEYVLGFDCICVLV